MSENHKFHANKKPKIKAKKSLGQNFLNDQKALQNIVNAAEIQPEDLIVEIGPGKGALTEHLVKVAKKVIAVEKDDRLIPYLNSAFVTTNNIDIIHGDALTYLPPNGSYKIVANIPYYITSPLLTHYLYEEYLRKNLPTSIVILIQKEVAEKICNPKKNSVLSLSIKFFGKPEYICTVKADAFRPKPKVDSAVIRIVNIKPPIIDNYKDVLKVIKHCFRNPRKTLHNNVKMLFEGDSTAALEVLQKAKLAPGIRPEKLKKKEWITLWKVLKNR